MGLWRLGHVRFVMCRKKVIKVNRRKLSQLALVKNTESAESKHFLRWAKRFDCGDLVGPMLLSIATDYDFANRRKPHHFRANLPELISSG